jgi:hypothetical protein
MENSIRQPTKKMVDQLKKCYEMQLGNQTCFPEHLKSSLAGLYKRGFITTRMQTINNKNLMTVHVTKEGERFLEKMHSK